MENIHGYENENYKKATPVPKNSFFVNLDILLKLVSNLVIFLVLLIMEVCENMLKSIKGFPKKKIENQLALVTGGANGLGKEIACKLAEEKCNIVIIDLNLNDAKKTAEFIAKTYNVKTKAFKVDVSKLNEIQNLKIEIENNLGPVDILVNNAGILPMMSLREGKPEDIKKIIDVNLVAHFWVKLLIYN